MKEIKIAARWARTEVLVRREVATVAIVLAPKPALLTLSGREQWKITNDAQSELNARSFSVNQAGDNVALLSDYFAQFFHVRINEDRSTWEYDGGEVSTLSTHYDRSFELP